MRNALILALLLLLPVSSFAADHSQNWCADAVDFAMRTAQYRDFGRTWHYTTTSIAHDSRVFRQQYPDLSTPDMQRIAGIVYKRHWTHFGAAAAMSKSCEARARAEPPALFAAARSDEWCANAVDFAMGVSQNRELEFTQAMISNSFDQNPIYYHMQFPELSKQEMLDLTDAAYAHAWTRFSAAAAVSAACRATLPDEHPAKASTPSTPAMQE